MRLLGPGPLLDVVAPEVEDLPPTVPGWRALRPSRTSVGPFLRGPWHCSSRSDPASGGGRSRCPGGAGA
eukprot:8533313-Alexandrium_andersonii.AAC.1